MATQEVKHAGSGSLNIVLKSDALTIDQVVVTALGIKRAEKSIELQCAKGVG